MTFESATLPPKDAQSEISLESPISVEFLPDIGIDLEAEIARQERWMQTGECTGPTPIGILKLTDEAIALLSADASVPTMYFLDHGDESARLIPDDDGYKKLNPQTIDLMNQTQTSFRQVSERDLAPIDESWKITSGEMRIGLIAGEVDGTHVDYPEGDIITVRYAVAIVGPGTNFVEDILTPDNFDATGDLIKGSATANSLKFTPVPTGVVFRFLANCDPHSGPKLDEEVFRIFSTQTASL